MNQSQSKNIPWGSIAVVSVDVDGTLYSVTPVIRRLFIFALWGIVTFRFRMVFEELKSILLFYRERRQIHENAGEYRFEKDSHIRNLLLERTSRFMAKEVGRGGLRPGVRETLEHFKKQGLRVVALSDHYSDAKLRALGVHTLFDGVYAAEATGHLKPHPEGFRTICKAENIAPHQLLHIGDRDETDGAGARNIGASSLILEKDFHSFSELRVPPMQKDGAEAG